LLNNSSNPVQLLIKELIIK